MRGTVRKGEERESQRGQLDVASMNRGFRALMDDYLQTGQRVDKARVFSKIVRRRSGLRAVEPPRHRFPLWVRWVAPPSMAIALASVAIFLLRSGDELVPLSYVVTAANGPQKVDRGLHRWSTEAEPLLVSFSDESTVRLEARTSVNLIVNESGRVVVNLERGRVHAEVIHHDDTDYRFHAGSYEVVVTGTQFDLAYDPASNHGRLEMREGSVNVQGPNQPLTRVIGGHQLELPGPARVEPAVAAEAVTPENFTSSPPPSVGVTRPTSPKERAPSALSYRALAKQARFAEIVSDAESRGLDMTLRSKPPEELSELAHAARYVGKQDLAARVLVRVAEAHPTSSAAKNAHFFLGRIAESTGELQKAAREYDIYVKTRPGGSYVAEALGRRMAIAERSRDLPLATSLARQYLSRFPSGPYRSAAASLIERQGARTDR